MKIATFTTLSEPEPRHGLDAGYDMNRRSWLRSDAWWCGRCGVGAMLGERMHRCADLNREPDVVAPARFEYTRILVQNV